ncbi:diguanylate cyclase [Demequina sp. NBRC 110054]|uniref:GGDEF domain-containing protein n=1 Tax=Demequina sp. NBRC 110054 TaxID=1570343 RepID=UPI0009FDB189|nr:sensor domain-containing diguanylate cyclase [Demequina sp. NBRC 110054]
MTELMSQGRVRPRSMFALGVAVMVFMFVAQLLIALWMRGVAVNGVADAVDEVMTSSVESAQEWVADYTEAVVSATSGTAAWISRASPAPDEVTEVLLASAALNPHFTTVVVAYPDGSWTAIDVGGDGDEYAFAVASTSTVGEGLTQTAEFYDSDLRLVETIVLDDNRVPLEVTFWEEASRSDDALWYVSDEVDPRSEDHGVWLAEPARDGDGELVAVVASSFPVEGMSSALAEVSLGEHGSAVVLDAERRVVAAPTDLATGAADGSTSTARATAESLGLATAAEATPDDSHAQFAYDGQYHVAEIGLESVGVPWVLQLRAVDEELAPQILSLRTTIQIASFAQFTVLVGGAVLFFLYWRPMKQIRRTAFTDGLTGLLRRSRFLELAPEVIADAHRTGAAVAVVVLDLDNFKRVNDEAGHAAGDRSLTEAARALSAAVRSGDLVCRWGGDEFVALVRLKDDAVGLSVAERLRSECETAFRGSFPEDLGLGATAGVVVSRSGDADIRELVDTADAHLIEGKQQEKSRSYAGTR